MLFGLILFGNEESRYEKWLSRKSIRNIRRRGSSWVRLLLRDNPPPPDKAGGLDEGVVIGEGIRRLTVHLWHTT